MANKLLVVEDDDGIRAAVRLALEDEGYDVDDVPSAEAALELLANKPFDLMLVDLMLGAMDGYTLIRTVRAKHDSPIVVLSARDDTHDIVAALEAGADDYLTKPFELKELTARLRALRRRSGVSARQAVTPVDDDALVLDSGDDGHERLVLDTRAGRVHRGGEDVRLTVTEFRLLSELASPPGRVLSRQSLLSSVWDRGFFGDERIVDVHVRRLRTKVERDPAHPALVVTVRGLGYRLDTR